MFRGWSVAVSQRQRLSEDLAARVLIPINSGYEIGPDDTRPLGRGQRPSAVEQRQQCLEFGAPRHRIGECHAAQLTLDQLVER